MCQQDIQEWQRINDGVFAQMEREARAREASKAPQEHTLFVSPFTAGEQIQLLKGND